MTRVEQTDGGDADAFSVATQGTKIYEFRKDVGERALLATFRVAVHDASSNPADAGFFITTIFTATGIYPDRANSIFIDPDRLGFMNAGINGPIDPSEIFSLDATQFHNYSILYTSEHLMQVYVDATSA